MLSIIIPTFNEEKYLPRLLKSIKRQTFKDYEVIVADNNSSDSTQAIAQKFGAKIVFGGMPGRGRNQGAKIARGEWLLFLDADVVLPPFFLGRAMAEIENSDFSVVTCLIDPLSDRRIDKLLHGSVNLYMRATRKFFAHAPGFCIFCEKEVHRKLNGFDEKIKLGEDIDYVHRLSKIANFGLLRNVYIPVSVRRLDEDGRFNIVVKYVAAEAHLIFLGPIYSDKFHYTFGHR